ncbi:immunoglobulin-like domain-containing protein, partial [Modicisalibacter xianhensis]|uniref:immunoglobulin-like domain-containing protein n=1 Tax=Modicisalibacter xianhensis TaxID=442341 RepID=UPI0014170A39
SRGDDAFQQGEQSQTLSITGTEGGNYEALDTSATATVTTVDDSDTVTATLSADTSSVAEGGSVIYTVTLSGPQGADLTGHNGLEFRLADGSTVTIAAGATSGSVTVTADDDAVVGGQDSLVNSIDAVLNASDSEFENLVTAGETTVTVTDEPGTPGNPGDPGTPNGGDAVTISIAPKQASYAENETPVFVVSIDQPQSEAVTVTLDNGQTVTIEANASSAEYTVAVQGDDVFVDAGSRTVALQGATVGGTAFENLTLGDAATVSITDTIDTVTATLTSAIEGNEDSATVTYTMTLGIAPTEDETFTFKVDGQPHTITVEAGKTTGTTTVTFSDADVYIDSDTIGKPTSLASSNNSGYEQLVLNNAASSHAVPETIDTTTVSISAIVTQTSEINVGNVDSTDSFTVTAYNADGSPGSLTRVTGTDHDGFGVSGSTSGSGASSELGYVSNGNSEKIAVDFNNQVKTFDVQFAWRNNGEKAKVEFFDKDGLSVGWAVVSGGGTSTQALVTYYDADGNATKTEHAAGGSDRVDNAYTFEPGSGQSFVRAEFTAVGHDDDYLIHSIKYKEVMDDDVTSIGGPSQVMYEIETSNPPDGSQYDFLNTFPTAEVLIGGQSYIVNLDRNGKGTVTVETNGDEDLVAEVVQVNGNFEYVDVPVNLTLYKGAAEVIVSTKGADSTVFEAGLTSEMDSREFASGTFQISASQGISTLTVGSQTFTFAQLQEFSESNPSIGVATAKGMLYLMGYSGTANIGTISYLYALSEAQTHGAINSDTDTRLADSVMLGVSGEDGSRADGTLKVAIIDDTPSLDVGNLSAVNVAGTYTGSYGFAVGADTYKFSESFSENSLSWLNKPTGYNLLLDSGASGDNSFVYKAYGSDGLFFTVTFKNDGTYDFELVNPSPVITTQVPSLLYGVSGGSGLANYTLGNELFGGMFSLVLSGSNSNGESGLWISSTELGVGDNVVHGDKKDTLTFDLVRTEEGDRSNATVSSVTLNLATTAGLKSTDKVNFVIHYEGGVEKTVTADVGPELGSGPNKYHQVILEMDSSHEVDFFTLTPQGSTQFKITGVSLNYAVHEFPDDYQLDFEIAGVDADLDEARDDFSVSINVSEDEGYVVSGTEGNDTVYGSIGADILYGSDGNDSLYGGLGADTFAWELGDQGTVGAPAIDIVADFDADEGDKLDLSDLLSGESQDSIDKFILAEEVDGSTTLHISTQGGLDGDKTNADQTVILDGVTMGGQASHDFIQAMINSSQLDIDK